MALKLLALENLSSRDCFTTDIFDFEHPGYPKISKAKWRDLCKEPDFQHLFFSGVEAEMPDLRVSVDNPAKLLRAVVADWDDKVDPNEWYKAEGRWNPKYPPNYIGRTRSGCVRGIWPLEKPIIINSNEHFAKIMQELIDLTFADRIFPCLDKAIYKPDMYYEIGIDWLELHDGLIPSSITDVISHRLLQAKDFVGETYSIPFEELKKELEKRWPGRWKGDFKQNSRGCRFWDNDTWDQSSSGDPHTAVLVMEGGCYNFSTMNGKPGFNSWVDIFGPKFCDDFALEKVGNAVKDWFYDGLNYHQVTEDGSRVQSFNVTSVQRLLRESGLSNKIPKGEDLSELEKAMNMIEKSKYVDGVGPFVNRHDRLITIQNKTFMNTSRSKPMEFMNIGDVNPTPKSFKLIHEYLMKMLGEQQYKILLSYCHDAYKSHYEGRPSPGQVLVLVGPPSCGKTFFAQCIFGAIMGSYQDASNFILGGSSFTGNLLDSAVWYLDDEEGKSDYRAKRKVTNTLKKLSANGNVRYEEKFKKGFDLPWGGRLVLLMNDDPESLTALPDLGISNEDKLIMLKCRGGYEFPADMNSKIQKELAYFAGYLYNFRVPEECKGNHRFGVKPFCHPDLKETARYNSDVNGLVEILDHWKVSYQDKLDRFPTWKGTTTTLLSEMMGDESLSKMITANKYTNVTIGRKLNSAITQGYKGIRTYRENGTRKYAIDMKL